MRIVTAGRALIDRRRALFATTSALLLPPPVQASRAVPVVRRCDMTVSLDLPSRHLEASGTITLPAVQVSRATFRFALTQTFATGFRVQIVEPAVIAGPLDLGTPEISGSVALWDARPRMPVPAGAPIVFRFTMSGGEKDDPFQIFQLRPGGAFASGSSYPWYPQIWDDGVNLPTFGTTRYRVVSGETLLSTGEETTSRADRHKGVRRFELRQPGFPGFAAGHYLPPLSVRAGIPLSVHLMKARPHVEAALPRIGRMMGLMQGWFGRYPQDRMQVAEAASDDLFGNKTQSLMLVSTPMLDGAWNDAFYAHEFSHAWFGGKFDCNLFFVSEGGANYAALQAIEALHGMPAARQFRLFGWPGYGEDQSVLGYLSLAAAGYDKALMQDLENYGQQRVGYVKGMLVMDMLARRIGRGRFNSALRAIMTRHPFEKLPWTAFEAQFSRAAGEDLRWFFAQWLERTGAPELTLEWQKRVGRVSGVLRQTGEIYRLDGVPLVVRLKGGKTVEHAVDSRRAAQPFDFEIDGVAEDVALDPDFTLLRATAELRAIAEALIPLARGLADNAYATNIAALQQALAMPLRDDRLGLTFLRRVGLGQLLAADNRPAESVAAYRAAWQEATVREDIYSWSLIRMARAAAKVNDVASQRWALERATAVDRRIPPSILGEEAQLRLARLERAR